MLRLRAPLPDSSRPRRRLPRALQRRRRAAGPPRLRGGIAARPGGEEAVLPRPARGEGPVLRHAGLRLPLRLLPELAHLAGAARPTGGSASKGDECLGDREPGAGARGPHRDLHLQRAAHHQRVGCGGVPGSGGEGPGLLVRVERQRHPGGPGIPPPLGLALQGRPEELPRPLVPRARGHPGARALDDPRPPRAGLLAGDRDPGGAGLQRLGRGAAGDRAVPGLGVTGHPLARDRVPPGLQDDRAGRHRGADPAAGGRDRRSRGAALRLCRESARPGAPMGEHLVPGVYRLAGGSCPECRRAIPGFWG